VAAVLDGAAVDGDELASLRIGWVTGASVAASIDDERGCTASAATSAATKVTMRREAAKRLRIGCKEVPFRGLASLGVTVLLPLTSNRKQTRGWPVGVFVRRWARSSRVFGAL
jgi:hypothetical protein